MLVIRYTWMPFRIYFRICFPVVLFIIYCLGLLKVTLESECLIFTYFGD